MVKNHIIIMNASSISLPRPKCSGFIHILSWGNKSTRPTNQLAPTRIGQLRPLPSQVAPPVLQTRLTFKVNSPHLLLLYITLLFALQFISR